MPTPGDVLRSPDLLAQCVCYYIYSVPEGQWTAEVIPGLDAGYGPLSFKAVVRQATVLEDGAYIVVDIETQPAPHGGSPFSALAIIYTGETPNLLVALLPVRGSYALATGEFFSFSLQSFAPITVV
jgi:hypothetical protein